MKKLNLIILLLTTLFYSCNCDDSSNNDADPNAIAMFKDVSYGPNSKQTFDIYLPANRNSETTKTIILIHGGSWTGGDKSEMNDILGLVRRSLPESAVVNMNYRLASSGNPAFPMQTDDIASVINKLNMRIKG